MAAKNQILYSYVMIGTWTVDDIRHADISTQKGWGVGVWTLAAKIWDSVIITTGMKELRDVLQIQLTVR